MAQQIVNIGTIADDGTGDDLRAGGDKINDNFTELYARPVGISNTAAANELMESDGTNATPSGLFSTSLGDINLGGASTSGSVRSISAQGVNANITFNYNAKGTGQHIFSGGYLDIENNVGAGSVAFIIRSVATNDDPNLFIYQARVATTDATVTTLLLLGTLTDNAFYITGTVLARRTGGSAGTTGDVAAYTISALFKNVSGTVTQVGAGGVTVVGESQAGWDVTLAISGVNVFVRVTGAVNNDITWHIPEIRVSRLGT